MALPMNTAPVHSLTLPSTGKQITYRPFLIREEKALMIAMQSEDLTVMVNTLKEVIANCVKTEIDVDKLPTYDLEYIFTQIRAKSVSEVADLYFRCDTCTDEKAVVKVGIDLTKLKVDKNPDHQQTFELYGDVGITMKYPNIDVLNKIESTDMEDIDTVFDIIVECIDNIYNADSIFYAHEQTKEELLEFLNNLSSEHFEKIQTFFETMPKLKHNVEYDCPVCGKHHKKVLEGLASFF